MTDVDDRRLIAEPIMAWKRATMTIGRDGEVRFRPVSASGTYGLVENAECRPILARILGDVHEPTHTPPHRHCSCGFYATKDRRAPTLGKVALRVELTGTVIVHARGYRAQRQRVVAIEVPSRCSTRTVECGEASGVVLDPDTGRLEPSCAECAQQARAMLFGLSDIAGRAGVDVAWTDDDPAERTLHVNLTAYTAAFQNALNQMMVTVQQAAETFERATLTTFTVANDGAQPSSWIEDEKWDDAVDSGPVHPLEAKRRRDEERRQRLEQLAGPKRAPRNTRRP